MKMSRDLGECHLSCKTTPPPQPQKPRHVTLTLADSPTNSVICWPFNHRCAVAHLLAECVYVNTTLWQSQRGSEFAVVALQHRHGLVLGDQPAPSGFAVDPYAQVALSSVGMPLQVQPGYAHGFGAMPHAGVEQDLHLSRRGMA